MGGSGALQIGPQSTRQGESGTQESQNETPMISEYELKKPKHEKKSAFTKSVKILPEEWGVHVQLK